jgi:hypothetical protein
MKDDTIKYIALGVGAYVLINYLSNNKLAQSASSGIGYAVGEAASTSISYGAAGFGSGLASGYSRLINETYGKIFDWNTYTSIWANTYGKLFK